MAGDSYSFGWNGIEALLWRWNICLSSLLPANALLRQSNDDAVISQVLVEEAWSSAWRRKGQARSVLHGWTDALKLSSPLTETWHGLHSSDQRVDETGTCSGPDFTDGKSEVWVVWRVRARRSSVSAVHLPPSSGPSGFPYSNHSVHQSYTPPTDWSTFSRGIGRERVLGLCHADREVGEALGGVGCDLLLCLFRV